MLQKRLYLELRRAYQRGPTRPLHLLLQGRQRRLNAAAAAYENDLKNNNANFLQQSLRTLAVSARSGEGDIGIGKGGGGGSGGGNDAKKEAEVRKRLQGIADDVTGLPITALGFLQNIRIHNSSEVVIDLDTIIPGYPSKSVLIGKCEESVRKLEWVGDVKINVASSAIPLKTGRPEGMSKVKYIIAVSSCKGGVGKSTTAMHIALALSQKKNKVKVGILDADIYGPSLPNFMPITDKTVKKDVDNPKMVLPLEEHGLKFMSFGFVNAKAGAPGAGGKGAAVMRGPIATKVINQLAMFTNWGDLDYLVIDMPPGTGDVQISLCQQLAITGSVVVTTPHALALTDAAKGVQMFHELNVPTLALVENMSYFKCDAGKVYHPFGSGGRDRMVSSFRINKTAIDPNDKVGMDQSSILEKRLEQLPFHSFPLHPDLCGDPVTGISSYFSPKTDDQPELLMKLFDDLTDDILKEILKSQLLAYLTPALEFSPSRGLILRYFTHNNAEEYAIKAAELRIRDPKTGLKLDNQNIDNYKNAKPVKFEIMGNYAVSIVWDDGYHADIFPFEILKKIALDCSTA